jgi:glucosamine-6-phosphate deaminase
MNLIDTIKGSLLENFFPEGWDLEKMDACIGGPGDVLERQAFWHPDFRPVQCGSLSDFDALMGHEIAMQIRTTKDAGRKCALILPVGPMGMYRWVVYFLTEWNVDCGHVTTFNMDEWSDAKGHTLPSGDPASFQNAMEQALFRPLGKHTVPENQRHFATCDALPAYAQKISALRAEGAKLVLVYGIGRMCHIAFWEPHFAAEYATEADWKRATHRLGAKLHPLTIEQNAITSFKSRTTLVPAFANTIGPGLFLQADYAIGGADGTLSRGMQWQGLSFWVTLRHGPTKWIASSWMSTIPGKLFFDRELAGPLEPECN